MDTASAKALLQSTDIHELRTAAESFALQKVKDPAVEKQYLKLQILLWSRILQLQRQAAASAAEQAATLTSTGAVWMRMGETDRAKGQFSKAMELQPTGIASVKTYQLLGQVSMSVSDYSMAAEHHTRAISELCDSPDATQYDLAAAYCQLAAVFDAESDFDQAQQWLEKAVEACNSIANDHDGDGTTSPQYWEAVATTQALLGTLKEKLGEYHAAVSALTVAHDALVKTKGEGHSRTKEIKYLLEMAKDLAASTTTTS